MAKQLYTNNATATLNADITDSTTTIVLTAGQGALFASPGSSEHQVATLFDTSTGDVEIIHITSRSTDTLTVLRGQEGTSGTAFAAATAAIEARATAGTLEYIDPYSQATGGNAVAIGVGATAAGTNSTVVGSLAESTGERAAALGYQANTTGNYSISVGWDATCLGADGIAIGRSAASAAVSYAVSIGLTAAADAQDSLAIGRSSNATAVDSMAIGYNSQADGAQGIAIGRSSVATGENTVALGYQANAAAYSVAVGRASYATAPYSVCISNSQYSETFADGSAVIGGWPAIQRESWFYSPGGSGQSFKGHSSIIASPPVDLGPGISFATSTAYDDQDVVVPTTPNGYQYYLAVYPYDATNGADNNVTSGGTEPTWPTTQGDGVSEGTSDWVCIRPDAGITVSAVKSGASTPNTPRLKFVPTRAGFICFNYASITAEPFISVGNGSSATAYVNNQQLTGITQSGQVQWIDISNAVWCDDVVFTLETAGTGSGAQFHGRFLIEGFHIQTQD